MAFKMKTWVDRLVEFPGRRRLTDVVTGEQKVYDVARNEGTVSKEGYPYNAANMNDLEQRIVDEFSQINSKMFNRQFYNLSMINLTYLVTSKYLLFDAPYSGYYYMYSGSGSNNQGNAFVRFGIKNYTFVQSSEIGAYNYITSPVIYIKKGTKMIAQGSDSSGSEHNLLCFKDE